MKCNYNVNIFWHLIFAFLQYLQSLVAAFVNFPICTVVLNLVTNLLIRLNWKLIQSYYFWKSLNMRIISNYDTMETLIVDFLFLCLVFYQDVVIQVWNKSLISFSLSHVNVSISNCPFIIGYIYVFCLLWFKINWVVACIRLHGSTYCISQYFNWYGAYISKIAGLKKYVAQDLTNHLLFRLFTPHFPIWQQLRPPELQLQIHYLRRGGSMEWRRSKWIILLLLYHLPLIQSLTNIMYMYD